MDKNKFKEILTIIDSNKFGHKNKIGDFKYIDIKDLVNNIKDNTISEIDAKKWYISGQKELLNLFNDFSDMISTDKTLISSKDENEKSKENKNENEKLIEENDNEKLKEENENENENEDNYENEDDYENEDEDDETMSQNKKEIK